MCVRKYFLLKRFIIYISANFDNLYTDSQITNLTCMSCQLSVSNAMNNCKFLVVGYN